MHREKVRIKPTRFYDDVLIVWQIIENPVKLEISSYLRSPELTDMYYRSKNDIIDKFWLKRSRAKSKDLAGH